MYMYRLNCVLVETYPQLLLPPDVLMCCLYFSATTGIPAPPPQVTGSTPQSTGSSVVVHADVHRANVEKEDEDYDDVLEMEQGNDGEDLEAVAADGRFQPIHNLIYMCTCTELFVKIDSKETHLSASVFVPVVVVEGAVLLLQPVPEMLIRLENVKAQIKRYVSTDTL